MMVHRHPTLLIRLPTLLPPPVHQLFTVRSKRAPSWLEGLCDHNPPPGGVDEGMIRSLTMRSPPNIHHHHHLICRYGATSTTRDRCTFILTSDQACAPSPIAAHDELRFGEGAVAPRRSRGVCEKAKFVRPYFEHTHTHAHGMEKSPVCIGLINFINANWTIPRLPATHATCYVLDEQQCSAVRGLHVKCATPYAAGAGLGPKRQSAVGFWVDPEIESENRCVRFKGNAGIGSACSTLPCQQFPSGPG